MGIKYNIKNRNRHVTFTQKNDFNNKSDDQMNI